LSFAVALASVLLGSWLGFLLPAIVVAAVLPREWRRSKAAKRAGLTGFIQQASSRTTAAEREEKLLRLSRELAGSRSAQRWLHEVEDLLIKRADADSSRASGR
jgi:hypothetical protein